VHEYIGIGGRKLAKSDPASATADPQHLLHAYGQDALRWWLTRDVNRTDDTDFTEDRLRARYQEDLANTVGNLVNRTVTLVHRSTGGRAPEATDDVAPSGRLDDLAARARRLPGIVDDALDRFDLRAATSAIVRLATAANAGIENARPWRLVPAAGTDDRGARRELETLLAGLVTVCRTITTELEPFVPQGAARLRAAVGVGPAVGTPVPAFPRTA
jgi:methionyl-tRNA synthetase